MSVPDHVPDLRLALRADCGSCAGLCCVVPAFAASSDFAIDKPSRTPCPNLATDSFGCTIHTELPERGFPGCTVYDCFGAGQAVVARHGRAWRTSTEVREALFADLEVVERLHELLWYLVDALDRPAADPLHDELEGLRDRVLAGVAEPAGADVVALQLRADGLLGEVSALVRDRGAARLRGRDLVGQDLRGRDLVDADLRGALLLGSDLSGLDLGEADLLGTDLRGCDLRGTDLTDTLFLTLAQVRSARTDPSTRVPAHVVG